MSEPLEWLEDGTPYSPRFQDRYHSSANHGRDQARDVFLHGCGLPGAWAHQPCWRILETGFGFGLNFLVTWAAWRADPARPARLHFVSTEAWPVRADDLLRALSAHADLLPLARELAAQWWGLLPGVHRLRFDGGRVLLTLCVGDAQAQLREQALQVDSVYLDGFSPDRNPELWSLHTLKAVARGCRPGTRLATWSVARSVRDHLTQCGFAVERVPGVPPKRANLQAVYAPRWQVRGGPAVEPAAMPARCLVVGAGIAGAGVAHALALRGWQVQMLDRGTRPAAGASGLPAGVFAPHVSPDDGLLSRLSRAGVRCVQHHAHQWLHAGSEWAASGVLEHRTDGTPGIGPGWMDGPGADWTRPADAAQRALCGLPDAAVALWHAQGGWLRPGRLVPRLLEAPGIAWRGSVAVAQLRHTGGPAGVWQALDADGQLLAEAERVVVAAGYDSRALAAPQWPLYALRGQVSWAPLDAASQALPSFPVNGHGNLVPAFGAADLLGGPADARAWVMGSTFERGITRAEATPDEQRAAHALHRDKLAQLLPAGRPLLGPALDAALAGQPGPVRTWGAVRCTTPDRRPIVGPVDAAVAPGLWICTAMGARGLTLGLLCGELLAARWHAEPLPTDPRLAQALGSERLPRSPPAAAT